MPNNATQLYHKNPDLQIVLDFLDRCVPEARQMVAYYEDAHALEAVKAACAELTTIPVTILAVREPVALHPANENARHGLVLDREDWLALAGSTMSLQAQTLRMRLPAINAALKLVPVPWDALAIADDGLAAWGLSAGMVALPGRAVFNYFGSRYPDSAQQRRKYAIVRDVEHAAAYKESHGTGFLLDKSGTQNFACSADDWQSEVTSAKALLDGHLSLMLKIGLQMLEAGASSHLKDLHSVLALSGETPSLVRLHTLLETYQDHVESYGAGQNRFRSKLLQYCLSEFDRWRTTCSLADRETPAVAHSGSPVGNTKTWTWIDSGAATMVAPAPDIPIVTTSTTPTTPTTPTADPIIAEGVIIPAGVTVARGAHVRVCAITPESRLKPGTVLHGDVSIASHTRFDGALTIMHDVRIGRGLTFGSGLILTEGATISSFAVKCPLPRGTRIGGSLRIGKSSKVENNVSFGAENWLGERVHIGQNVRFGPCIRVDNDISIGANAWIEGHTRLIADVPENAQVATPADGRKTVERTPSGPRYAIGMSPFSIAKNETIRERPANLRKPLASELDVDSASQDEAPQMAVQAPATPDQTPGKKLFDQPHPPEGQNPSGTPPVHPDAPRGVQRKRGGDALAGPSAKRLCTGLESRYKDTNDKPNALSRLLNQSAFEPVHATSTSTMTSTTTAWLDLQRPLQPPPGTASTPGAVRQRAPELLQDRDVRRKAWESSVIGKENQNALERGMRQSIRVPTANPGAKPDERAPEPVARLFSPMFVSKGPNL